MSIKDGVSITCTQSEFNEALDMTMSDIKFNRIGFGKRTSIDQVIRLVETSILVLRKC